MLLDCVELVLTVIPNGGNEIEKVKTRSLAPLKPDVFIWDGLSSSCSSTIGGIWNVVSTSDLYIWGVPCQSRSFIAPRLMISVANNSLSVLFDIAE